MLRREFLTALAALAASPLAAATNFQDAKPFDQQTVNRMARELAKRSYRAPKAVPSEWTDITYDDYVSIWFDTAKSIWNGSPETPLRLDFFAPGLYFPHPVNMSIVEDGYAIPITFSYDLFHKTDKFPDLPVTDDLGFSGVRLRAEIEKPGIYQEFAVFQGASYFRGIGTGQTYGLSARGLAIDTAGSNGEEFPEFRAFWIERPARDQETFRVHALLDSPSCTGAYVFDITPGAPLVMDVSARVFTRRKIGHLGLAPLTSMFKFDETNRDRFSDFRPAVHDSDGLLMRNGAGETIWRPLANPKTLQISAFQDRNPQGFGLMQRAQEFNDFEDLEALYHQRPGVWIEPKGAWGPGSVVLVEIPTELEIYDNIVSYWRPRGGLDRGVEHSFEYRLLWDQKTDYGTGLKVLNTRMGGAFRGEGIIITIDFENGPDVPDDLSLIDKLVRGSAGEVSEGVLQRNPETGGPRLAFKFHPGDARYIEFRAALRLNGAPLSEVWLYRWTV